MPIDHLTDQEIALKLAQALRDWRVDPAGAGMTREILARRSGIGVTPLKRFEATGGITLKNLIAIYRGLGLLDRLEGLIPEPGSPGPMALLEAERGKNQRRRAPRAATETKKNTHDV